MRALDAASAALAAEANDIDAAWSRFKTQCLKDFKTTRASGREFYLIADDLVPAPTDDQCRMMYGDLAGRVKGFQGQLDIVEAAARKADLLPADVREVFDRHRLTR